MVHFIYVVYTSGCPDSVTTTVVDIGWTVDDDFCIAALTLTIIIGKLINSQKLFNRRNSMKRFIEIQKILR